MQYTFVFIITLLKARPPMAFIVNVIVLYVRTLYVQKEVLNMYLKENKLREIIFSHFRGVAVDHDLFDLIENILDRVDDLAECEVVDVYQAMDDELIWYSDQWLVLQTYCTPQNANWEEAIESFTNDVLCIVQKYQATMKGETNNER